MISCMTVNRSIFCKIIQLYHYIMLPVCIVWLFIVSHIYCEGTWSVVAATFHRCWCVWLAICHAVIHGWGSGMHLRVLRNAIGLASARWWCQCLVWRTGWKLLHPLSRRHPFSCADAGFLLGVHIMGRYGYNYYCISFKHSCFIMRLFG